MVTKIYKIENLACAHCGAKIEQKLNTMDGIEQAVLTFATKQLRITAQNPDALFSKIKKTAEKIEPNIILVPQNSKRSSTHTHEESCSCNHGHYHEESCSCNHEHSHEKNSLLNKNLISLIFGVFLFALASIFNFMDQETVALVLYVISYLFLGLEVLFTAGKHLVQGQIFDENFLMSIATLGAFAIRQYPEAVGVMLFYRIGEFFEEKAVERSRSHIMKTADLRSDTVTVISGSETHLKDAQDVVIGDILFIRPGDRIPLDGIIIEGESRIDTSPVTGEPVPVKVSVGDSVISGCINTSGLIKIRVEKVLEDSMVSRILESIENAAANKPKLDRFITRFAKIYTPAVITLALITAIIPSIITHNWSYWIYTALSFLVISCPCALVLSIPLSYFSGIGAGSKLGILFKGGASLEAIQDIDTIVMDKTGTLTAGNFKVQKIVPISSDLSAQDLLSLCAQCESASTHPIAHSIVSAAKEEKINIIPPESLEEFSGLGTKAYINGHSYLCGNKKLMNNYQVSMEQYKETSFGTEVFIARDGILIGHLIISDTLKSDSEQAISSLTSMGINTIMFTGDSVESAKDIASRTGITNVKAHLLPEDKLNALKELQQKNHKVMFVGDGINDAPVLAGSNVGAAMGNGADAAIEAADIVFMTSNMAAVPTAVQIARNTNKVARENIVFALVIKFLVMILGLFGYASMWMAVFADTGVAILCVLHSIQILYKRYQ